MSRILAGHFTLQDQIGRARSALVDAGFAPDRISAFYVNQPGQHDLYPLGGDEDKSPGAAETPVDVAKGMAGGGAVGAAIGAATAPVTGPAGPIVGALVGAHVGSLYSLHGMKEADQPEHGHKPAAPRQAGMMLAVALEDDAQQARALAVLRELGAEQIEQADGTIVDGDWSDFDPLSEPSLVS